MQFIIVFERSARIFFKDVLIGYIFKYLIQPSLYDTHSFADEQQWKSLEKETLFVRIFLSSDRQDFLSAEEE